ncbi:MAG: hypothetical protein A4E56_02241 [Pelotomaculum sp. PtaU1.Bin065]|nr:MAG: hypothetical protein A4E56_02241 [Pelotomaculum sp. PtaU1.Bin065]
MSNLKVWEKRVSCIMTIDDPEEKELVSRFNKDFTSLLRVVPKVGRRVLFDMLYIINELYGNNSGRCFKLGLNYSYKRGLKYGTSQIIGKSIKKA